MDVLPVKVTPLPFDTESLIDGKKKWIVFTSSNGVRTFFRKLKEDGTDLRRLAALRFAVIGRPTGNTLRSYGVLADLSPEVFTSRDLAERIREEVPASEEIVLLRAENATDTLPSILKENGYSVREVAIYRTEADEESGKAPLPPLDFLVFSSAGGTKLFSERFGNIPEGVRTVAIGKITKKAMEETFGRCDITAETAEVESIARAVEAAE